MKKPASFYENYFIFDTWIRCDFTFKLCKAKFLNTVEKKKIDRHNDTSFLSIHTSLNQIIFRDTVNLKVNLEPGVLNELIGEPLSTTEDSSTDIFAIYSILLLNS